MNFKITHVNSIEAFEVKTSGEVNADEFIVMAEMLLNQPEFTPNCNVIFDHTALNFNNLSCDDLQKIRTFHIVNEERIGRGKSSIVVNVGLLSEWHKIWSKGQKIKTRNKVQVFESYDDAVKWIVGK
ncbi:MAG: hypothetical protein KKD07_07395 [Candidatus Omnitrophica bacterium]|nr:hypothetical protein [Candidatus Omnitrophota bacterium]MBU1997197.1 hypothetical protein [Candidatus Omnitrophota bacterium]MBU4334246.1 hypothetical protein [Candidatus Omnitrophota bacterium]